MFLFKVNDLDRFFWESGNLGTRQGWCCSGTPWYAKKVISEAVGDDLFPIFHRSELIVLWCPVDWNHNFIPRIEKALIYHISIPPRLHSKVYQIQIERLSEIAEKRVGVGLWLCVSRHWRLSRSLNAWHLRWQVPLDQKIARRWNGFILDLSRWNLKSKRLSFHCW